MGIDMDSGKLGLRYRSSISIKPPVSVISSLRKLDVYNKVHDDYAVKTSSGGFISILSFLVILFLFISETHDYLKTEITDHVVVDTHMDQPLPIDLKVTFPYLRCSDVSVDTVDSVGEHQSNIQGTLQKYPLHQESSELSAGSCGSCYDGQSATTNCCNSCDELEKAYEAKSLSFHSILKKAPQCALSIGCSIEGKVMVNKVSGNVHVALGKSSVRDGKLIHEFNPEDVKAGFDTSHTVERLRFGDSVPGVSSPLENGELLKNANDKSTMFHYYIKLVPTVFKRKDQTELFTNQYSATETVRVATVSKEGQLSGLPGVYFVYDFTPFLVEKIEKNKSFGHYLTGLVAIVGGVFGLSAFADILIYSGVKKLRSSGVLSARSD
eukprot:GDKJ01028831.1.p1 GENE.GDKJ01028831.1~~GDKJ01028831.1.p1  ORF type:complete len:381 (-),score=52.91 GDKJ01028831.1:454-1596(-)